MKPEIESVSIRFPRPLKDWVQREAEKNFRSQNAQVLSIIEDARQAQIGGEQREKAVG